MSSTHPADRGRVRPKRLARRLGAAALAATLGIGLAACAPDSATQDFLDGTNKGYIAADGFRVMEFPEDERDAPIVYGGVTDQGERFDSAETLGEVVVVNFWYAACGPCRVEASVLEEVWQEYQDQDVAFLGVNTRDQAETSLAFAETYGVSYPSIIDIATGEAKLAFAAVVPPQATPTTVVIDKQGRVAARLIGAISQPSILSSIVRDVLAEDA